MNLSFDIAYNGKDALDLFDKSLQDNSHGTYKIIFMDVNMPVMDGIESTKQIRLLEEDRNDKAFIVGVTANMDTSIRKECLNEGMNLFKTKPFEYSDLKQVVNSVKEQISN